MRMLHWMTISPAWLDRTLKISTLQIDNVLQAATSEDMYMLCTKLRKNTEPLHDG